MMALESGCTRDIIARRCPKRRCFAITGLCILSGNYFIILTLATSVLSLHKVLESASGADSSGACELKGREPCGHVLGICVRYLRNLVRFEADRW